MEAEQVSQLRQIADQQRRINRILKERFENEPNEELRDLIRSITFLNRLHAKTLDRETGLIPVNNYEYTSQEGMVEQSEAWLKALEEGRNLFAGRFSEVDGLCVDHAFFKVDGRFHLIYIRLEACNMWQELGMGNFGHASSQDLLNWEIHQPVLPVIPGSWENTHVWAPHVFQHDERYWMFYTGVNENACQAINAAVSTDLVNWERVSKEPLIIPPWGLWAPEHFSNCRDPFVLKDDDGFYCYYTGYVKETSQYCVGIAYSNDLINWEDRGYSIVENSTEVPPESPFVIKRGGIYHLFYTSYTHGTVVATSTKPDSGFCDVSGDGFQVLQGVTASEFLQDEDGQWYMTAITHETNHFHFIEFYRLEWPEHTGGTFKVVPVRSQV
ncbi:family 43 glycosylhydrolase [Paenibacillus mendelii]|uniref:Family 43 glycosylhydrolase n=1 Tax=Paenibacillus mendelii TaxID=206163 RepID=A0ABV6JDR3_9BACL|nr:family 43 glycosylhydrolase [Paenibacillus mendelii]MCQ6562902.1 family 43 glycosylhydrolase [Paenibacillus mendelii]